MKLKHLAMLLNAISLQPWTSPADGACGGVGMEAVRDAPDTCKCILRSVLHARPLRHRPGNAKRACEWYLGALARCGGSGSPAGYFLAGGGAGAGAAGRGPGSVHDATAAAGRRGRRGSGLGEGRGAAGDQRGGAGHDV